MIINNRFEIKKKLGQGGVGEVYLAEDLENNRRLVVIKFLLESLETELEFKQWVENHFFAEAKALERIDHPGVVKLIAVGHSQDNKPFFAMEYIEGSNLRFQIKENLLRSFTSIAQIIQELGSAIGAAHQKGVYHRDLKPENIMLEKPKSLGQLGQIKVIDFGIATVKDNLDEKTRPTALAVGSILYMAPEQIEQKPGARSDIYALGVIAYELITGRPPFTPDGKSTVASMVQLLKMQKKGVVVKPRDLRPSLSLEAERLILQALSFNPSQRPANAKEFGEALAEALLKDDEDILDCSTEMVEAPPQKLRAKISSDEGTLIIPPSISQVLTNEATILDTTQSPKNTKIEPKSEDSKLLNKQTSKNINLDKQAWLRPILLVSIVVVVIIGSLFVGKIFSSSKEIEVKNSPTPLNPTDQKNYSLGYWGQLQKYQANKPKGNPVKLSGGITGEISVTAGDALAIVVKSSTDGYFYLLNESKEKDHIVYTVNFPVPKTNQGSSKITANQELITDENVFDNKAGTEIFWLVWSSKPIDEIEKIYQKVNNSQNKGRVSEVEQTTIISSFLQKHKKPNLKPEVDVDNNQAKLIFQNDVLAYSIKLTHQ